MDRESGARLLFLYDFIGDPSADPDGQHAVPNSPRTRSCVTSRRSRPAPIRSRPLSLSGVYHHPDVGRRYGFTFVMGRQMPLPSDLREMLEDQFGIFTGSAVV